MRARLFILTPRVALSERAKGDMAAAHTGRADKRPYKTNRLRCLIEYESQSRHHRHLGHRRRGHRFGHRGFPGVRPWRPEWRAAKERVELHVYHARVQYHGCISDQQFAANQVGEFALSEHPERGCVVIDPPQHALNSPWGSYLRLRKS